MSTIAPTTARHAANQPIGLWCWVNVGVAALAMVATMPGRSHGLGLVTEPLLRDFHIDDVVCGHINLWGTLLGALFCLPCGWLIDRIGLRLVLAGIVLALGLTVVAMSRTHSLVGLAILILLTRGLGQSALSVVSLGIVGKTPFRRREMAMGIFSVLVGIGFAIAVEAFKATGEQWHYGWRESWAGIGWLLIVGVLPLGCLFLREPASSGMAEATEKTAITSRDATLAGALRTPVFWAFALTCSFYLLVSSGFSLYYERLLAEFGFQGQVFMDVQAFTFVVGIGFNLLCGWLAQRYPAGRVLGLGSLILAVALMALPWMRTVQQLYLYAIAVAFAGGAVTVVFFAVWRHLFGLARLGQIQGAAQMLTVLASGLSQLLFPVARTWFGSYVPLLQALAGVAALLGVWVWCMPVPRGQAQAAAP